MAQGLADGHHVDTVIIGNGPSALILSYILHGHIPFYTGLHHDPILHSKLSLSPNLLQITLDSDLAAHFASSLRYTSQALPINALLDTLIRPNADTEPRPHSCVQWQHHPDRAVSHLVLGDAPHAGGQWADDAANKIGDIGTLSYAEMLSLPGYSFAEHYKRTSGRPLPDFMRPSRREVAEYLAAYPEAVEIADAISTSTTVRDIHRTGDGFFVGSHGVRCNHLVLASGIFSKSIAPPPLLKPLSTLSSPNEPVLVIGSGFTAADVIITTPPNRKVIHIFRWNPDDHPSPLRGCHHQAYPEYAGIYRRMRLASASTDDKTGPSPWSKRRRSDSFLGFRNWETTYEGLPNAEVVDAFVQEKGRVAAVSIRTGDGQTLTRRIGSFAYVVGRRGSLGFLDAKLRAEVLLSSDNNDNDDSTSANAPSGSVSGRTLRAKAEQDNEIAPHVFAIGSLTGDSLIRFAFGGCVSAAGKILEEAQKSPSRASVDGTLGDRDGVVDDGEKVKGREIMNGNGNGHVKARTLTHIHTHHTDLHLDRRKIFAVQEAETSAWRESGWWGGCYVS